MPAERAGIRHAEIGSRDADICCKKHLAQDPPGGCNHLRDILGIGDAKFLMEELAHLTPGEVDGRSEDVAGPFAAQLDDVLAQVRFNGLQPG